ncbi:MAG: hypothetical protein HW383_628 [Candidatus Magasanikbacteria bacterium]|nr:hypothetical protein [Candidatus Magasanikbacteria bacterium]
MSEPIYRPILKDALRHTFRHPSLWILGILASFLGHLGAAELITRAADVATGQPLMRAAFGYTTGAFSPLADFLGGPTMKDTLVLVFIFLLAVILLVAFIYASVTGQAALISAAHKLNFSKQYSFRAAWRQGSEHFWPVFSLNLLRRLVTVFLMILLVLPWWSLAPGAVGSRPWIFAPVFIIVAVVSILISFMIFFAICSVVLEKRPLATALKDAWQMLIKHWLASFEVAVILFALDLVILLATAVSFLLVAYPFYFLTVLFSSIGAQALLSFLLVVSLLVYAIIIAIVNGIAMTFEMLTWVGVWNQFRQGHIVSKVLRFFYHP